MSDDNTTDQVDIETTGSGMPASAEHDPASHEHGPDPDAVSASPESDTEETDFGTPTRPASLETAVAQMRVNMTRRGVLRIHHASRDIDVDCDGFNALRVIAHFTGQSRKAGLDEVSAIESNTENGWTGLRYRDVVAITWIPTLGTIHDTQVAFDPT